MRRRAVSIRSVTLFLTLSWQVFGSGLTIERATQADDAVTMRISVPTLRGVRYELRGSVDLLDWQETVASFSGNGETQAFEYAISSDARFFKVNRSLQDSFVSAITGIAYPVHVYLPSSYASDTSRRFPIIYATDGQWIFNGFSGMIAAKNKQVILVAIEQGPGDRRAIDYTPPGSANYFRFLVDELIPAVESVYRVDPLERTLSGTSYGGLLVGYALLMDDVERPAFRNYLSFDGSFGYFQSQTIALENSRYAASSSLKATLLLTSATAYPNNDYWVTWFRNRLNSRHYQGLEILRSSYPVVHNDIADPSFNAALDLLF